MLQKRNLVILVIQKYMTWELEGEQNWFYEIWNAHHHQHLCLFIIRLVTSIDVFIVVIILKEIIVDEQVRKLPIDYLQRFSRFQIQLCLLFFWLDVLTCLKFLGLKFDRRKIQLFEIGNKCPKFCSSFVVCCWVELLPVDH